MPAVYFYLDPLVIALILSTRCAGAHAIRGHLNRPPFLNGLCWEHVDGVRDYGFSEFFTLALPERAERCTLRLPTPVCPQQVAIIKVFHFA